MPVDNAEADVIVDSVAAVVVGVLVPVVVAAVGVAVVVASGHHNRQGQHLRLAVAVNHSSCSVVWHKVVFGDPVVHRRAYVGGN